MTSRFATFTMFFLLACATNVLFGQTGYYDQQQLPASYPQTHPPAGWNAGSPTGIPILPHRLPQPSMAQAAAPLPSSHGQPLGYGQMVAHPSPNPVYYVPAAAPPIAPPPTAPSYWTEIAPAPTPYAPPNPSAVTGYFAPPMQAPSAGHYLPVAHGYYGGPAGSPATQSPPAQSLPAPAGQFHGQPTPQIQAQPAPQFHGQHEGTVLSQPAPSMYSQETMVPYDGSMIVGGNGSYVGPATPGMYGTPGFGAANRWGAGFGQGNARFGFGAAGCTSPWFVGFGGLVMTRDHENHYLFSYDIADESIQLTNARNANFDWAGGFEVNFGRMFNCGQNAVEAVYWGLFPSDGRTITTDADTVGGLNGILNWDQLDYGLDPFLLPRTGDEFVNNSTMHMVQRQNEIHNVEVNFLSFLSNGYGGVGAYGYGGGAHGNAGCGGGTCGKAGCDGGDCGSAAAGGTCGGCSSCGGAGRSTSLAGFGYGGLRAGYGGNASPWSHEWLVGVRYFSFRDHLLFGAEETGGNGVFQVEDDEIYYNIDITNRLVGAQLGFSGAYAVSCRCSLDYGVKLGLFGNQINHTSEIGGSQGVATINNGPNAGIDFFVQNSKRDVAFLGEANLGVAWKFGNCWSAKIGYRAVAVTGVALPTNQIWHDLRGIQDVEWVDSNGSLILHGGYARAEYRF